MISSLQSKHLEKNKGQLPELQLEPLNKKNVYTGIFGYMKMLLCGYRAKDIRQSLKSGSITIKGADIRQPHSEPISCSHCYFGDSLQ